MICDCVLPLAMLLTLASGYNYCNNETHVCNLGGLEHFVCRLDKELPAYKGTIFEEVVPDTPNFQTEVLVLLNNFRDILSSGQVMNKLNMTFPSATRMRRLVWDNELAYLARIHASSVSFQQTKCRSTLRFPIVGEIMTMRGAPVNKKVSVVNVLRNTFRPVWRAHKNVEDPKKFIEGSEPISEFLLENFAIMVNDRVSRVGCGIALGSNCPYKDSVGFCHFVTCYFDNNHMVNTSIYKPGMPTSNCDEWGTIGSSKWTYLCKNLGQIFQND